MASVQIPQPLGHSSVVALPLAAPLPKQHPKVRARSIRHEPPPQFLECLRFASEVLHRMRLLLETFGVGLLDFVDRITRSKTLMIPA